MSGLSGGCKEGSLSLPMIFHTALGIAVSGDFPSLSQFAELQVDHQLSLSVSFLPAERSEGVSLSDPAGVRESERCVCDRERDLRLHHQVQCVGMELVRDPEGVLRPSLPPQFPFTVGETAVSGRRLVASREIRPGQTILTDSAILVGPASPGVCVVCCSSRPPSRQCGDCRHRLCSSCHHDQEECRALAMCGYTKDMYNVILPIRFGLLRSRDPEMFEWLLQNMDHNQERNRDEELRKSTQRMVTLVSGSLGLGKALAARIIGILFTNCFEFKVSDIDARALYPLVSLINHSCVPNMRHTNLIRQLERGELQGEHQGEIVVMQLEAQRTILPNTELTIRYNDYMTVRQLKYYCFVLVLALGDIPLISTEKLKCILFHF